jgi:indolepyruvate ferredoxin oxidoreductase
LPGRNDRFGIIASGKAYNDTRQALADLGLDDDTCRAIGHALAQGQRGVAAGSHHHARLCAGLQEILVVEEKRQVIEYQIKEELYNWRPDVRPNVLGKFDDTGKAARAASGAWPTPARTGCCAPRPTCRRPSSPRPSRGG